MNLLSSVEIAIVIVATDLRIRRFTPMAERVLNLIPGDVGRPISHIKPNIDCPELEQLISNVIDRVVPQERQVQDSYGNAFLLRIRPYKNVDNRIDGAVLTLFDVDAAKRQGVLLRNAREFAKAVVAAVNQPVVVLDESGQIYAANQSFSDALGEPSGSIEGSSLFEVAAGVFGLDDFRIQLLEHFRSGQPLHPIELWVQLPGLGRMHLEVKGSSFETMGGQPLVLLTMQVDREPHPS